MLVVVPSRVLMEQWCGRLADALPEARIGRLGDSGTDRPATCDVLVATRHSAAAHKPVPPDGVGGLLVADECHGLGGATLRRAMLPQYEERLGLTATLERTDDAVTELLIPYFGGICHRYGFEQAIADGVCAAPRVAFVGVELSVVERRRVHGHRAPARRRPQPPPSRCPACRWSRSATSSPRWRTSPSATRAPTGAPRASTSTRSRSGGRSSPSRAGSTSCSGAWRPPSATRTARWCSPRRCGPPTTPSTASTRWSRST